MQSCPPSSIDATSSEVLIESFVVHDLVRVWKNTGLHEFNPKSRTTGLLTACQSGSGAAKVHARMLLEVAERHTSGEQEEFCEVIESMLSLEYLCK